jgi:hypothetical protein
MMMKTGTTHVLHIITSTLVATALAVVQGSTMMV